MKNSSTNLIITEKKKDPLVAVAESMFLNASETI